MQAILRIANKPWQMQLLTNSHAPLMTLRVPIHLPIPMRCKDLDEIYSRFNRIFSFRFTGMNDGIALYDLDSIEDMT